MTMHPLQKAILRKTKAVPLAATPKEACPGKEAAPSAVCGTSSQAPIASAAPSGIAAECGIASHAPISTHASQTVPTTGSELALAFLQGIASRG
jgi:hypothetical protein